MTKTNSRIALRCTGLALLAIAVLLLLPGTAQAQQVLHGVQILKGCTSPVSNCNSDLDCSDGLACTGIETCSTPSATEPTNNCTIRVTNVDEALDTLQLESFVDVFDTTGTPQSFFVEIATVQDNAPGGDTTCLVGDILGTSADAVRCDLGPGDFITFVSNDVTFDAADAGEVFTDQASVEFFDLCDGTQGTGCDPGTLNLNQASGSTTVNNNCQPGTPVTCPAPEVCHLQGVCEEPTGTCTNPNEADSTPCGPDTGEECATPGCFGGVCVQTHIPAADSTPCGTDADTTDCATPGCFGGSCIQTHIPVADSTPCGTDADPTDCTEPGCFGGACLQTHIEVAASTPCAPDTDGLECTIPGCVAGGICSQTHVDNCVSEGICRTPGFWGARGGTEKTSSENTTLNVLANFGGSLVICGQPITNTDECSPESALEAICVSPKGDSSLQLARQLTAAALNCAVTQVTDAEGACVPAAVDGANPCDGQGTIEDLFQACNAACPGSLTGGNTIPCNALIDCFNNGFAVEFDEATNEFSCGDLTTCHENDSGCFDQTPPNAAGSSRECNDSRKNCVTIFGLTEQCDDACVP